MCQPCKGSECCWCVCSKLANMFVYLFCRFEIYEQLNDYRNRNCRVSEWPPLAVESFRVVLSCETFSSSKEHGMTSEASKLPRVRQNIIYSLVQIHRSNIVIWVLCESSQRSERLAARWQFCKARRTRSERAAERGGSRQSAAGAGTRVLWCRAAHKHFISLGPNWGKIRSAFCTNSIPQFRTKPDQIFSDSTWCKTATSLGTA